MSRSKPRSPMAPEPSPDAEASSACNSEQAADAPPVPFAPKTAFVLGALRQIQAQSGRDCARTELVDALAACCLYSGAPNPG
jgi:hypothetical protein